MSDSETQEPKNAKDVPGWGVEALTPEQLEEVASADPCFPVRNLAGHRIDCNYGDWPDFTKCQCAEGLLTVPETPTAVAVAPLPLRDHFASLINVSDELAGDLALGMRAAIKKQTEEASPIKTVNTVLGMDQPEPPPTVVELADAKAKIKYLEADALCSWRITSAKLNADAAKAARPEPETSRIVLPV